MRRSSTTTTTATTTSISPGTTFELETAGKSPLPKLYRNDGAGNFIDVARLAVLTRTGWGQGVCVGDYDNDGDADLANAFFGFNTFYRNNGDGSFRDATRSAKLPVSGNRWGSALHFGLGKSKSAVLEVRWPSGKTQNFPDLAAGRYTLAEDGSPIRLK